MFGFGGTDPETGVGKYVDAFAIACTKENCLAAWEAVGAVPQTHACLNDKGVCHKLGDASADDVTQITMQKMQRENLLVCDLLTARGLRRRGELNQ